MKTQALLFSMLLMQLLISCKGQPKNNPVPAPGHTGKVGGDCEEGYCELMYVGMPKEMNNVDTSAGWYEAGRKLLVTGIVYQLDGKTRHPMLLFTIIIPITMATIRQAMAHPITAPGMGTSEVG
jgi:protocatechuate 3,4-dioxygenase beta subunit